MAPARSLGPAYTIGAARKPHAASSKQSAFRGPDRPLGPATHLDHLNAHQTRVFLRTCDMDGGVCGVVAAVALRWAGRARCDLRGRRCSCKTGRV